MKRILLAAAAFATIAMPLAASPAFADQAPQYSRGNDRHDDRNDNRRDTRTVVKHKTVWHDTRRDARWDANQHNGYWTGNAWHYGPPPASAYRTRGFQLGYKPWARGDRLGYYGNQYREVDYRTYHLQAPKRGYHYVRDDNSGEIILAAVATGIIASIIANN
ncbi:MAG TPA: RcnB family protein [Hyphomonadaceae bacterium]|jgi:Ni/Co efflux regulator RcnB|nr:RcnB family protein [Hyphomonadaceae bacterium]